MIVSKKRSMRFGIFVCCLATVIETYFILSSSLVGAQYRHGSSPSFYTTIEKYIGNGSLIMGYEVG